MATTPSKWCILRTSGSRTLRLTDSLAEAGLTVWTPRETVEWRRPRSNVRQDREMPIMPSFVFLRADELPDILCVLALPISPHPQFSIFMFAGRVPLIADRSIVALRAMEEAKAQALANKRAAAQRRADLEARKLARKEKRADISIGGSVNLAEDAAFAGVTGIVQSTDGRDAWIRFGKLTIKVDAWKVLPISVADVTEAA